jgi:UDP-N-acetyl-2-amino-2-deoxyglucuronate dehydrogenase
MSQRNLGVGIIGCGKIAINHATAIQGIPEVELVASVRRS